MSSPVVFPKRVRPFSYEIHVILINQDSYDMTYNDVDPVDSKYKLNAKESADHAAYCIRRWGFSYHGDLHVPSSSILTVEIVSVEEGEIKTIYPKWMWWKHKEKSSE